MINCNIVASLLLLSLSVSGTTNGSDHDCIPQIKVPRNIVFKARVMTELKINCTVTLRGCHRSPRISWCKIYGNDCKDLNQSDYIKTEWKNTAEHEGKAFLIFLNISMEDAGLYRCKEGDGSVAHAINVTVTGPNDDQQWLWPYVYICSGIAGLMFIVMTVTLLYVVRRHGRKLTRNDVANKNQYMKTQNSDLLLPHLYLNSDLLTSVIYRV